jgi:hypothetical protein
VADKAGVIRLGSALCRESALIRSDRGRAVRMIGKTMKKYKIQGEN